MWMKIYNTHIIDEYLSSLCCKPLVISEAERTDDNLSFNKKQCQKWYAAESIAQKQDLCFYHVVLIESDSEYALLPTFRPLLLSYPPLQPCHEKKAALPSCHPLLLQHSPPTSTAPLLSLSFCTSPLHLFICPPTRASNLQFYHSLNPIHSTCFISSSCLMNSQCLWVGFSAFHQTIQVKSSSVFVICTTVTVKQSLAMKFFVLRLPPTMLIQKVLKNSHK